MITSRILIIDENEKRVGDLTLIFTFLEQKDVVSADCNSWQKELEAATSIQVILVGDCGNEEKRNDILAAIRELDEDIPVLLLNDSDATQEIGSLETTDGILGGIVMPASNTQLSSMLQKARIYRESRRASDDGRTTTLFRSLVGNSRAIRHVRKLVEQVASSTANVLILGESGTGKEVVARNLHYNSPRRDKPFVPINCGAIPADLLESELFGHEKGAFTGAITARQGRFEMAEGGTLFLDEIGDMSLNMQVKLLRVLQERTFERVGSNKSITADVRIIAATHRNLE